jgi:hypothetical protein
MFGTLRIITLAAGAALSLALVAACDQGPVEKAGKDIDRITGQDGLLTKGPAQKAGRDIDGALDNAKR